MLKSIKAFIFGTPSPTPVVVHTLLYPENEISVIETVDGFILQRVKTKEYYCMERYRAYNTGEYSTWKPTRKSPPGGRQYELAWCASTFATKQGAIDKAIQLEKAADAKMAEAERRKNFVERKVWR